MVRLLYQFPMWWQKMYRTAIWRIRPERKAVYLTFDDGPIPEVTPRVLDVLRKYNVKATFFMVADNVRKHPEVYRQVVAEGHAVGNHTYHHVKGMRISTAAYLREVDKAAALLGNTRLFRPPYGRTWVWQRKALLQRGYKIYLWDVLTHDYNKNYSPERMLMIIKTLTRNGSIINFHDSVKSNERMLEVLPQAIEWLLAEGYEILPIT
ncbi:MAG: polysaccharide deacetylase family protein [Paludibacteraceae bacterium]